MLSNLKKSTEGNRSGQKKLVEETIEKYAKYINPGLARYYKFAQLDTVEWASAGSKVWDVYGNEYIDCLGGFGEVLN